jgi:hypothetical protein
MHSDIHVGSTLVCRSLELAEVFHVPSDPFADSWSMISAEAEASFPDKISTKGWHLFFIASQIKAIALGGISSPQLHGALQRILRKAERDNFNCVEVTQIKPKHFFGVPYLSIVANSRHVQVGSTLHGAADRKRNRVQMRWAQG